MGGGMKRIKLVIVKLVFMQGVRNKKGCYTRPV